MSKRLKSLGYFLVIILFVITILRMDFSIVKYLSNFNVSTIIVLVLLQLTTITIISHQWYSLARVFNKDISFFKIIDLNIIGTFTESITPAVKSGGEGVKLFLLKRDFSLQYNEGLSVVIVQKVISALIFIFYFCIALTQTRFKFELELAHCLIFLLVGVLFFIALIKFIPISLKERIIIFSKKVSVNLKTFKGKKFLLGYLTFNNLIVWLGYPIKLLVITRAFDVNLSFLQLSAVIFITYGVSMLPTTPGSIGTYEGTMAVLLRLLGVSTQKALAIAIVTRFFTFWLVVILSGLYLGIQKLYNKRKTLC